MAGEEEESSRSEATEKQYQDDEDDKDDETRAAEEKAQREAARKRCYKYSDPPKLYTDVKVSWTPLWHSDDGCLICHSQQVLITTISLK